MLTKAELEEFIAELQFKTDIMAQNHKICKYCWDIIVPWYDEQGRPRYTCYCTLD